MKEVTVRGEKRDDLYPVPAEVLQVTTPATLLNIAIDKGADLEKLEKLMELQMKWEANQARKAYTEAMANFKQCPPDIEKDKHVKFKTDKGVTEYKHASLANVTNKINSALGKCGLSAAWTTIQEEGKVKVTCRITHIMGHFEETSLTAGMDSSGSKNPIQALGSTISYLERYTILALTGLATRDMDDDAKAEVGYITEQQFSTITDMINSKNVDANVFLRHMGAEDTAKILAGDYDKAMDLLRRAKGRAK